MTAAAFLKETAPTLIGGGAEAVFSPDKIYRYRLTRTWGSSRTHATWVMLNPSTADAMADDPTIRRCTAFTKAWGLDGLIVVNLFAFRSPDPCQLMGQHDPVGPANDQFIREAIHPSSVVIAAWGANWLARQRTGRVMEIITERADGARCLGVTKDGYPKHPLYVPSAAELVAYTGS